MCEKCRRLEQEVRRLKEERNAAVRDYREIDTVAGSVIHELRLKVERQAAEIGKLAGDGPPPPQLI